MTTGNNQAKALMLQAIEDQLQERLAQLESEDKANKQRLTEQAAAKKSAFEAEIRQEYQSQEATLRKRIASDLQIDLKRFSMEIRHQLLTEIMDGVYSAIQRGIHQSDYIEILFSWIIEAISVVSQPHLYLQVGQSELFLIDDAMIKRIVSYTKEHLGIELELSLHPEGMHHTIGPIISTKDGRRLCDNSLTARFAREKIALARIATAELFEGVTKWNA